MTELLIILVQMTNFNSDKKVNMKLDNWKLNSTGTTLEFIRGKYKVVVNQQEDIYGFLVSVYDESTYRLEREFTSLNDALKFIERVHLGDKSYD